MSPSCDHSKLQFSTSSHAPIAGYKHPDLATRVAAATAKVVPKNASHKDRSSTFPAPLILPEDDLAWEPDEPPQSLRSWTRGKHRNKVTPERRTVYFMGPPDLEPGLEFVKEWAKPRVKNSGKEKPVVFPKTDEVLDYLKAFYHGLPVKLLPLPKVCFTNDIEDGVVSHPPKSKGKKKGNKEAAPASPTLWLNTQKASVGCIGIRTRATPDGSFSHQLNLNDLLDAAIEILPGDAYALLMMVEHDIFEDEDDDFAVGNSSVNKGLADSNTVWKGLWWIKNRRRFWSTV
jgi:archaemetzincin